MNQLSKAVCTTAYLYGRTALEAKRAVAVVLALVAPLLLALIASQFASASQTVAKPRGIPRHQATGGKPSEPRFRPPAAPVKAHVVAKPVTHARHTAHAAAGPVTIYDSSTPGNIPAGADGAAYYANGSYAASSAQAHGHRHVLWIDVNGSRPDAQVLDVEPGDATPQQAAQWVSAKVHRYGTHVVSRLYESVGQLPAVRAAVNRLPKPERNTVRYWAADPTGHPHIVPGTAATQYQWNAGTDVTLASAGFAP